MAECPTCNGDLISTGWAKVSWAPIMEHVCDAGHISWWQSVGGLLFERSEYRHKSSEIAPEEDLNG